MDNSVWDESSQRYHRDGHSNAECVSYTVPDAERFTVSDFFGCPDVLANSKFFPQFDPEPESNFDFNSKHESFSNAVRESDADFITDEFCVSSADVEPISDC